PHARLVIAGRPVGPDDTLRDAAVDERVRLHLRHVPDAEVQVFLNAADLVVLPYRAVLTSGAAMLALSFGRGIVAPRVGCLADLERTGAAILYDPVAPDGLPSALARAMDADPVALGERARRFARSLSWDAIARRHLGVYGFAPSLTVLARRVGATPAGPAPPARVAGRGRGMDLVDYYNRHWTELPEGDVDWDRLQMIVSRVRPGDLVLEAGCGPGFLAKLLKERGARVIGTDVSQVGARRTAGRGIETH